MCVHVYIWPLNFSERPKIACGVGVGRATAMTYFEVMVSGLTEIEGTL